MIRSIAKHRYISGKRGRARATAHINYIAHRAGPDREQHGRKFFTDDRDDLGAREVKQRMYEHTTEYGVTVHKFILSPGVTGADLKITRGN